MPIKPGLYEQLVTMAHQQELSQLDNRYQRILSPMDLEGVFYVAGKMPGK